MHKESNSFTILDWIGWVYVLLNLFWLSFFPKIAANFCEMYIGFGATLPKITKVVLHPWFSITLGVITVAIFSLQLNGWVKARLKRRRAVVVLAFILSSAAFSLCVIAIYKPIFMMAAGL